MRNALRVLLVVSTVAVVGISAAYAGFGDDGTATGSVEAGTVELKLTNGGPLTDDVTVLINGTCRSGNMAPGDECSMVGGIGVRNTGSLTFDYTLAGFVQSGFEACYEVTPIGPTDSPGDAGHVPPGDPDETFGFTVKMKDSAPNSCQGETVEVGVRVSAFQDTNDPHNPTDTH